MSARAGTSEKELAAEGKKADAKPAAESKKAEEKPAAESKAEAKAAPEPKAESKPTTEPKAADTKATESKADENKAADKPSASEAPKAEEENPPAESHADAKPAPDSEDDAVVNEPAAEEPIAEEPAAESKPAESKPAADKPPAAASQEIKPPEIKVSRPSAMSNGSSGGGGTRTIGINLSAAAKFTTLVAIEWHDKEAWISEAMVDLEDDELIGYLSSGERIGVYAPFGWPVAMVEAVASYTNSDQWQRASRRQFRHRETEAFVHDVLQSEADQELWPQSVSCDRLALQARRMAQLREQLFTETGKRFDRAGGDHILEVYAPGASLLWGLHSHAANGLEIPPDASEKPGLLFIERIEASAPWLHWKEGKRGVCLKNEHTSDALLAALVARAAELDLTIKPENGHLDLARREGWMHLPSKGSLPALATT
jgi:hypothetical protein